MLLAYITHIQKLPGRRRLADKISHQSQCPVKIEKEVLGGQGIDIVGIGRRQQQQETTICGLHPDLVRLESVCEARRPRLFTQSQTTSYRSIYKDILK